MKYNKMTTLTKEECQDIRILMWHAEQDLSYGGGGTYTNGKEDKWGGYQVDQKAVRSAKSALKTLYELLRLVEKHRED